MNSKARMKLKIKDKVLSVKFQLKHKMLSLKDAKRKQLAMDYITHIVVKSGSRVLFEFQPSMFVSKNPIFKFKVKQKELKLNDVLEITWTSYLGKTERFSKIIERVE